MSLRNDDVMSNLPETEPKLPLRKRFPKLHIAACIAYIFAVGSLAVALVIAAIWVAFPGAYYLGLIINSHTFKWGHEFTFGLGPWVLTYATLVFPLIIFLFGHSIVKDSLPKSLGGRSER